MDAVKNISITIPYGMYKSLKTRSEREKQPYSEIARTAIDQYLQGGNKSEVIKTSDN